MEDVSKLLNLSNLTTSIYFQCLGKIPLSFNEINSFKSELSKEMVNGAIDELVNKNLLIVIKPQNPQILNHYFAVPPFFLIENNITQIKTDFLSKEGYSQQKIKAINEIIFLREHTIELDDLNKNFLNLQKEFENNVTIIEEDLSKLSKLGYGNVEIVDTFGRYEEELKKIITSELAGIVVTLLQLKKELQDKIIDAGITHIQWDSIKNSIKDVLALKTHEKAQEINEIITEEFEELRKKTGDVLKERYDQKAQYLEILNSMTRKFQSLHDSLTAKRNTLNVDLKNMEQLVNSRMFEMFQDLTKNMTDNVLFIDEFLKIILQNYTGINLFSFEKFWLINSQAKISEEISNILANSHKEILLISPKIESFMNKEELLKSSKKLQLKIASPNSHEDNIVQELLKNDNIRFRRLRNKNMIGINGDNSVAIVGIIQEKETDILKNFIGFGTNHKPFVDLLNLILTSKWEEAKPQKEVQITDNFNYIIKNINNIKGNEIGKILQESLDIAVDIEGMSLNVLDMKLLISKLKTINTPIDKSMKGSVIEKIETLNKDVSKFELSTAPELKQPEYQEQEVFEEVMELPPQEIPSIFPTVESSAIDIGLIEKFFNIFEGKVDELKGTEISRQIEIMSDTILKFQGFSQIVEWKKELKSINSALEGPFKNKIREDLNNWKQEVITPKIPEEPQFRPTKIEIPPIRKEITEEKQVVQTDTSVNLDNLQYVNHAPLETTQEGGSIRSEFNNLIPLLDNLSGAEISKKLLNITDIILETKGYSMALKEMKQMNDKIRPNKGLLNPETKNDLINKINLWKEKFG